MSFSMTLISPSHPDFKVTPIFQAALCVILGLSRDALYWKMKMNISVTAQHRDILVVLTMEDE